jgi:uncharacterized protein with HEPN domain
MKPEERDLAYIWDMREAARDVMDFVEGVSYVSFCSDKKVRYAVERRIEVIGEAARHVSQSFQESHPEIPWKRIIGLRNILAHEYGEILVERIWRVAVENVPELYVALDRLIPPVNGE